MRAWGNTGAERCAGGRNCPEHIVTVSDSLLQKTRVDPNVDCIVELRSATEALSGRVKGMTRGQEVKSGSVWVPVDVLQDVLKMFEEFMMLDLKGEKFDDASFATAVFSVRSWANRSGEAAENLCDLPANHKDTDAEARVREIGEQLKESCSEALSGVTFNFLAAIQEMCNQAAAGMACRAAGLEPDKHASMVQHEDGLSFLMQSNNSEVETSRRLLHWVTQADYRMDYLEAMAPGSKAAIARHFGPMSSSSHSLLQLSDSDFINRFDAFRNIHALKLGGQHPWNRAYHPMRKGGPAAKRRRRRGRSQREEFQRKKCSGQDNGHVDELFASPGTMDGCSGPSPLAYYHIVTPVCFGHDACYNCGPHQSWCDSQFTGKLASECWRKIWWAPYACLGQAAVMGIAVAGWGHMHEKKAWCNNGCAQATARYDMAHIYGIDPWF